jgi:branched-chain amino acid transport system permease protein
MQEFLQLVVTGLVIGSVYALVAMGFALIYKSTSIINFAQGEFVLVGAYVCLWFYSGLGLPIVVAFLLTMVFSVFMGMVLERLILRPMIGEPIISVIMITIALATVLKSAITIIWGTQIMVFNPPIFSQEAIHLGTVRISEV